MTFQALGVVVTLLLTGGVLGAGASLLGTILQNRAEAKRAKIRRAEEVADRKLNLKRGAYTEALKEFNYSAVLRFNNVGNRNINTEELLRVNNAMTLFDMYAPDEIKILSVAVIRFLKTDLPATEPELGQFKASLMEAIRKLSFEVRKDLGQ